MRTKSMYLLGLVIFGFGTFVMLYLSTIYTLLIMLLFIGFSLMRDADSQREKEVRKR